MIPDEKYMVGGILVALRQGASSHLLGKLFHDEARLPLQEKVCEGREGGGLGVDLDQGCAHAGLVNTLDCARELTSRDRIEAVIGGTHLLGASSERISWTIEALRKMNIPQLALSHCTGFVASARLYQAFGPQVRPLNVGDVLEVKAG